MDLPALRYEGYEGYSRVTASGLSAAGDSSAATPASAEAASEATSLCRLRLVLQRADAARILLRADSDAQEWVAVAAALVVYISFTAEMERAGKSEQTRLLEQAAKAVLFFPILTRGQWGDGTKTVGAVALAQEMARPAAVSLVVVPQASLSCKIKPDGKGASYRALASKEAGEALFAAFVETLSAQAATALVPAAGAAADQGDKAAQAARYEEEAARKREAALVPPEQLFRTGEHAGAFSAYDARGLPTADAAGAPLAKNALKKLEKLFAAHCKSHEKEVARGGVPAVPAGRPAPAPASNAAPAAPRLPEDAPVRVVAGTYGQRQGLVLESACGPFAHTVEL